jgi:DNA helicase-2/ATP-dependent DNA helicase PcrA
MSEESQSLTDAQREAVEHAGGPLIVLAGPGTGKTRTIVHRIAHQITSRGIEPERIVALTFTIKAAGQLRERLAKVVGATQAERVNAHTIHSFGNKLVQRFADLLGLSSDLQLIDAAQSRRLLKQVVMTNCLFADSRAEGLSSLVGELHTAFDALANLGLLPRACEDFASQWGRRLEGGPGAMKKEEFEAQRARQRRFADTAKAYALYVPECQRRGWFTFGDQITLPIRLLNERPAAAAICRDDYRAFIVDEFQDCNAGQIELLRLLAPPREGGGGPDLCVVGDDDQAIYRFRGADERAFQRFTKIWPSPKVVELNENYRSQPELIRIANAIITKAQSRFHAGKVIEFPKSKTATGAVLEAVKLEEGTKDADLIATMILADRVQSSKDGAPRPWGKYAVIARGHAELDRVESALRLEGIPLQRVRERSRLEDEGVEDVLAWIEWLLDPEATWAARRVLTRPPYGLPPDVVAGWEIEHRAQASQAGAGRADVEPPGKFVDWLEPRVAEWPAALAAIAKHRELSAQVATARGDEAVFRIMVGCDAAHAEILSSRERARRVSALISLLALAREKQARLEVPGDLRAFWAYFNELTAAGQVALQGASLESALDDTGQEEPDGPEAEGFVQLLTAHASKGLEFDTVFVPRVIPQHGYPTRREREEWQAPEGIFDRLDPRSDAERHADEERRIFYVACTRAERRLVLLAKWNKKPSESTHYFEQLVGRQKDRPVMETCEGVKVLEAAARLGVGILARSGVEVAGHDYKSREFVKENLGRIRRQARLEAALALESVDRPDLAPEHAQAAADRLQGALRRAAIVSAIERTGAAPQWLTGADPELAALAQRLETIAKAGLKAQALSVASLLVKPLKPPLRLSFTSIYNYEKCGLCYYLQRVWGLPEEDSDEANIGNIAHQVLKEFFDRLASDESDGLFKPGLEELLALARRRFLGALQEWQTVKEDSLDQLLAQMKLLWERLHASGPDPHILETECSIEFPYQLDGQTHKMIAKIDRIDLMPDGGVRIIDYKTGRPAKRLLDPEKNDLQLGIYALALRLGKNLGWAASGGPLHGVAEYWCLATGQKGSIKLVDLNEPKIRERIDAAAMGMLKGRFDPQPQCDGPCRLFRD